MKDEFLSIIMECAASIVNEKNSENSLLRDECGETLYGQVLTQLTIPMIVDDVELDIKYKYVLVNETPKLSALHSKLGCAQEKDVIGMLLAGFNAGYLCHFSLLLHY